MVESTATVGIGRDFTIYALKVREGGSCFNSGVFGDSARTVKFIAPPL